ncbi:hypothetical protein HT094_01115 [Shewanella sp. ZOR0012]|nr:hypothetical protein [Shewanella sp. ZOR0012]
MTDGAGASSTQNLTITLTGTNDGATITDHGTPGQLKEDQSTPPSKATSAWAMWTAAKASSRPAGRGPERLRQLYPDPAGQRPGLLALQRRQQQD